ncbi:MAG: AMP-binding protein, partial [Deltaproteobacteria bacterium]|nr:AMP-binding protein [Deltaproteobacteria bacterium]
MNLKLMLDEAVKRYGKKTAVAMGDSRLSYAQLDEASNKMANALIGMGMGKGDRVAMLLSNSPAFATIYFGVVKIGGIAVPLDTKYKLAELASLFDDSQPGVLVAESPLLKPIAQSLPGLKSIAHVIEVDSEGEGQFLSYEQIMATGSAKPVAVEVAPGDIAHIAYTSGPSFNPRGVMMSHQALVEEAVISGDGFGQTDKDIAVLFALPMHHAFGLVVILMTAIAKGSTVVIVSGLSIGNLMEVIEKEKATIFMAVPFVHTLIVNAIEAEGIKHNLSSIRLWGTAGAAMPANISQRIGQYLGFTAVDFWGMTESAAHVTCQSPDGGGKPGSVGKPLPGWELKVVDDYGRELPTNQPGEIIVRGPIMNGYYNNPRATAGVIKHGWLYTGDIGRIDEEGWLFLSAGRKKDMMIAKGQNIYPSDIEDVLHTYPKIAEAAVVGIPDEL